MQTITSTITETATSTSTSTSTVLGVATQCLPSAITSSPVRLFQPGAVGIAGTAEEVGSRFPINNVQDCCSACYLDTSSCVAFSYGVSHSSPTSLAFSVSCYLTFFSRSPPTPTIQFTSNADSRLLGLEQNFDNRQFYYPPNLDTRSSVNSCRIYRDVFDKCRADVSVFDTRTSLLPGEVNNVGIGPCTPDVEI